HSVNRNDRVVKSVGHKREAALGVQSNCSGNGARGQRDALHERIRAHVNHLNGGVGGAAGEGQVTQNLDGEGQGVYANRVGARGGRARIVFDADLEGIHTHGGRVARDRARGSVQGETRRQARKRSRPIGRHALGDSGTGRGPSDIRAVAQAAFGG